MLEKKAIIISQNLKLSKQIEYELLLLGYKVKNNTNVSDESFIDFDILIYDSTNITTDIPPFFRANFNIFITSDTSAISSAPGFDKILKYPFLLEDLRNIILTSPQKKLEPQKDTQKNEKTILLNKKTNTVIFKNTVINLSENEFRILNLLCNNSGNCVSREDLSACLGATDGNIADVYICHLRRKLEYPFGVKIIYTLRSKGYMTDFILK